MMSVLQDDQASWRLTPENGITSPVTFFSSQHLIFISRSDYTVKWQDAAV